MKKNDRLQLQVSALSSDAMGVCRHDGQVVFVAGALPGEQVEALIVKVHKTHAFAKVLRILSPSSDRREPPCPYFPQCGGCGCQHMDYKMELEFKRSHVREVMARVGGLTLEPDPVIGMDDPWHYRNKSAMPVVQLDGRAQAGFYAPRSHRVIPVDQCLIGHPHSDTAARCVLSWMNAFGIAPYDENAHSGLVRHIVTRVNRKGATMLILVVNGNGLPEQTELLDSLRTQLPSLVSLCISANTARSNTILGDTYTCLWGQERLLDELCGFVFALSPLSFFQVNAVQAEKLYQKALALARPKKDDLVIDLYCGAGTISSVFAAAAREVIGIEVVPQAIQDARSNAQRNGLSNLRFLTGKAEDLLPPLIAQGERPDIIVLDPPRKGAEPSVLDAILSAAPRKVVYVSCHPATQARDAKVLCSGGYRVTACCPVDMFCHTPQVENILLLEREDSHVP